MSKQLKTILVKDLSKKQLEILPTSFDVVGDILIFVDFPEQLKTKEKIIAQRILEHFTHINVVCKKTKHFGGTYRTSILRIMGGERRKETIHKENGIRIKLHTEKVYFSPRTAHERERIFKQIKKDEQILVMFSGSGVLPITISKNTQAKSVIGVEINPDGHRYAQENAALNKTKNVTFYQGDVNDIVPTLGKFDRIAMPLPKSAEEFLTLATPHLKPKGILHFYDFMNEKDFEQSKDKIRNVCNDLNRKCRILSLNKCGQFGPGKFRICVDARIE